MAATLSVCFGLAGFLTVMMIVIGGVTYIASGANEGLKLKLKGYINGALQGRFGDCKLTFFFTPSILRW